MKLDRQSIASLGQLLKPLMESEQERKAILFNAFGSSSPILSQVNFGGSTDTFISLLLRRLADYGEVEPNQEAICVLLETVRGQVGIQDQRRIDSFLSQVQTGMGANFLSTDEQPMTTSVSTDKTSLRDQVFISYSHKDGEWLEKLQTMLKPLIRQKTISVWDDTKILPGSKWRDEITQALAAAKVAVLLVSPNFLASDFIAEHELTPLLAATAQDGVRVIWVPVSASMYTETEIATYQAAHDPARPLDSLSPPQQNQALVEICKAIKAAANA